MNPETGRIYRTPEEIEAARKRGEPLVELTPSFDPADNERGESYRLGTVHERVFNEQLCRVMSTARRPRLRRR